MGITEAMSDTSSVRLFFPADPRRPFALTDVVHSLAKVAGFDRGNRVLVLGCGASITPLTLAKELGCKVWAVDSAAASVQGLRDQAKKEALNAALDVQTASGEQQSFGKGFNAIVLEGRLPSTISEILEILKPQLAKNGRVTMTVPVRIRRSLIPEVEDFWRQHLPESLMSPADALQALERCGFEPQTIRSMSDEELGEFYASLERTIKKNGIAEDMLAAIQDEIAIFRKQDSHSTVSQAIIVGRRREPGEKPPPSRSDG